MKQTQEKHILKYCCIRIPIWIILNQIVLFGKAICESYHINGIFIKIIYDY